MGIRNADPPAKSVLARVPGEIQLEAARGTGKPRPERLEIGLLARPHSVERARDIRRRKHPMLFGLREEARGNGLDIARAVDGFYIHANPSRGANREQRVPSGVREIEIEGSPVPGLQLRSAVRGNTDPQIRRLRADVTRENFTQGSAARAERFDGRLAAQLLDARDTLPLNLTQGREPMRRNAGEVDVPDIDAVRIRRPIRGRPQRSSENRVFKLFGRHPAPPEHPSRDTRHYDTGAEQELRAPPHLRQVKSTSGLCCAPMSDATRVPLLDLEPQLVGIRSEVDAAIARVLDRGEFILSEEVEQFESDFARHCQTSNAVGCASGTDALLLSLMALGIGPGDQVICPAYSFFASAGVITRLGATPVFADIDPGSLNLDPTSVDEAASSCRSLRAVVVVHLFGRTADSDALRPIAAQHGATLVHDAAQAVGALDEAGKPVGASGELSAFSFYPSKNLGAFGDAGAVTTGDSELAERLRQLRVHGASTPCYHETVGINSRLDELQAAVLRVRLRHVESGISERRACAAEYDDQLAGHTDIAVPERPTGSSRARHGFHQYTIRVPGEQRDTLIHQLREGGIDSAVYYPRPLHQQPCFASASPPASAFPEAEAAARETLSLPIYPGLQTKDVHRVASKVRHSLASTGSARTK